MCRHRAARSSTPRGVGDDSGNRLLTQHERVGDSDLRHEPAHAAVGERPSDIGVPRANGLPNEVPHPWSHAIVTELRAAMHSIEIRNRRSEARSTCGLREVERVPEAPGEMSAG